MNCRSLLGLGWFFETLSVASPWKSINQVWLNRYFQLRSQVLTTITLATYSKSSKYRHFSIWKPRLIAILFHSNFKFKVFCLSLCFRILWFTEGETAIYIWTKSIWTQTARMGIETCLLSSGSTVLPKHFFLSCRMICLPSPRLLLGRFASVCEF